MSSCNSSSRRFAERPCNLECRFKDFLITHAAPLSFAYGSASASVQDIIAPYLSLTTYMAMCCQPASHFLRTCFSAHSRVGTARRFGWHINLGIMTSRSASASQLYHYAKDSETLNLYEKQPVIHITRGSVCNMVPV